MPEKSLLIIHQGALGDLTAIFPAIYSLSDRFSRVDVVCQSQLGKLAQYLGLATRWYPLEGASFSSLYTDQPDPHIKARLGRYDQVILFSSSTELEQSLQHIIPSRCIRIEPKPPAEQSIHITAYAMQNLTRRGLIRPGYPDLNRFHQAQYGQEKSHPRRDSKKILLHPGSGSKRKRWPVSQFKQIESRLNAEGLKTEFVLGPAEEDLLRELESRNRKTHMLFSLIELVELYHSAGGYIGNDSGASHLAAFVGLPTLVIFGPADPVRWKPGGPYVEVVRPNLACQPCFETEPSNCDDPKCLEEIKPDRVIRAFYRVYQRGDESPIAV
jgi:ADP-heptose:LPS heptosyltransferase